MAERELRGLPCAAHQPDGRAGLRPSPLAEHPGACRASGRNHEHRDLALPDRRVGRVAHRVGVDGRPGSRRRGPSRRCDAASVPARRRAEGGADGGVDRPRARPPVRPLPVVVQPHRRPRPPPGIRCTSASRQFIGCALGLAFGRAAGFMQTPASLKLRDRGLPVFVADLTRGLAVEVDTRRCVGQRLEVAVAGGVAVQEHRQRLAVEEARRALLDVGLDAQLQGLGLARREQRREQLGQPRRSLRGRHVGNGGRCRTGRRRLGAAIDRDRCNGFVFRRERDLAVGCQGVPHRRRRGQIRFGRHRRGIARAGGCGGCRRLLRQRLGIGHGHGSAERAKANCRRFAGPHPRGAAGVLASSAPCTAARRQTLSCRACSDRARRARRAGATREERSAGGSTSAPTSPVGTVAPAVVLRAAAWTPPTGARCPRRW